MGPRFAGNVGACARVAANFGCTDWLIAAAQCTWNTLDARKFATGTSQGNLEGVRTVETARQSVEDCQIAIGFSRRQGKLRKPTLRLAEIAAMANSSTRVALVFGNEESGLSSEELEACTHLCTLPTSEEMPSMNLSHAVAVVLGRISMDLHERAEVTQYGPRKPAFPEHGQPDPARVSELESLVAHWREFLNDIGLNRAGNPEQLVSTLRHIFARAGLSPREIRALRGMLSIAQVKLGARAMGKRVSPGRDREFASEAPPTQTHPPAHETYTE